MIELVLKILKTPLFWSSFAAISSLIINVLLFRLNTKTFKLLYDKPRFEISKSYAAPHADSKPDIVTSLISLSISNPSNFENTICSFRLFGLRYFHPNKLVVEKNLDIKISATSKIATEIDLDFEKVKNLRGKQVTLCLTDLKGSKIKKRFIFMPSYNQKIS